MRAEGNDRFCSVIVPAAPGMVEFEVIGEVDRLGDWQRDARRRAAGGAFDGQDVITGAALLAEAAEALSLADFADDAALVQELADVISGVTDVAGLLGLLDQCDAASTVFERVPPGGSDTVSERYLLSVSRQLAGFASWYECFPRSTSPVPGRHGTLRDLVGRLDYVAALGFDVLYLPPIHPIGITARKGRGGKTPATPDDVGSPWAIGNASGGHTDIAPELGTLADFDALVAAAADRGIEIALDLALQCSPDHPWVSQHPDWFVHRADGSIACAENPPKRYEDVYPIDFDTADSDALYSAVLQIVTHWIAHGVRVFRVDNPHTKPFALWEWLIAEVKQIDPGVVFLAEAFTRPKVMHRLAKLGFDESYTYFTWRESKSELTDYFEELAHGPGSTYFRPNIWPSTPDICASTLQHGGRAAFVARLVLAGCLSASYGIYGPAYELLESEPATPGTDGDFAHSEKFEVRTWDIDNPSSIADVVARVNRARREHRALQSDRTLRFHRVDNDRLICWSKCDARTGDTVLCVVNLEPRWPESGFVELDTTALDIGENEVYDVHDLLDDATYRWRGTRNFVMLDPSRSPAHVFALHRPNHESLNLEDPRLDALSPEVLGTRP